ncbi:hypothetical protein P153DRAFT_117085 [Dothidotthia symphoricarpi CBS 119687]|uniref:Uncharacterized protein n=1 Tax=Dothidotthia symphoricarpi CBS 119687 TaxID=1392245 RepID=A0A6A6A2K7_9PLEO|nr:uncharacterized protein P153DRAFT_117085 [Dothidotthia symphoricarpi CBS 119687]KAF2124968.1 hypothetical protein P153DRAFT_117085 [Dothidotthia symphoricarpi CBS 119687]
MKVIDFIIAPSLPHPYVGWLVTVTHFIYTIHTYTHAFKHPHIHMQPAPNAHWSPWSITPPALSFLSFVMVCRLPPPSPSSVLGGKPNIVQWNRGV